VLTGLVRSEQLKTAARGMDLKVGEFLVAVLIEAFQVLAMEDSAIPPGAVADTVAKSHTPTATPGGRVRRDRRIRRGTIRILVPVDLRRFFPSPTLRNFFGFVAPEIDLRLGEYSEDEIAGGSAISDARKSYRPAPPFPFLPPRGYRGHPSPAHSSGGLKRAVMTVFFPWVGDSRYSASLSNLGPLTFGEAADSQVRAAAFIPPPSPWTRTNCSVLSFGEQTVISFGSTAAERDVEREFFRIIRRRTGWCHVTGGNP
jgi:hypothetical protein